MTVTATDTTGASGSATFTWTVSASSGGGGGSCQVVYTTTDQWTGGFTASVAITNTDSSAISSWTLKFTFPGNQAITNAWNGVENQSGENVTISNESYNGAIAAGGSTSLGFQGTWSTSDAAPTGVHAERQLVHHVTVLRPASVCARPARDGRTPFRIRGTLVPRTVG